MKFLRYLPTQLVLALFLVVFVSNTSFARENYFHPVLGEVISSSSGQERGVTTEEGGLMLYKNDGSIVDGYPLLLQNEVFVTSPLFVDLTNDGSSSEIVVVGRNSQDEYTLYAYSGDKTLLAEVSVQGQVYYDPVAIGHDVVLATVGGDVVSYSYQNNLWTSTVLFSVGEPAAISVARGSQKIYVSLPQTGNLRTYAKNAGSWIQTSTNNLAYPLIYPVIEDDVNAGIFYGVNTQNQLVAVRFPTSRLLAGFPVDLGSVPVDAPMIVDSNSQNAGVEIAVPLADGSTKIISKGGNVLKTTDKKSNLENVSDSFDASQSSFTSGFHNFGIKLEKEMGGLVTSAYSNIKIGAGSYSGNPEFVGLTVRPVVAADGVDKQAAALTVKVTDPNNPGLDAVGLIINNVRAGSGNELGRYNYVPQTGFIEAGGNSFGNQYVNLLPQDAQNSAAGSQIIPNYADSTVTYIFRWTIDSSVGARATNTVDYNISYGTFNTSFLRSNAQFEITASQGTRSPEFIGLTVRPSVIADGVDMQAAEFTMNVSDVNNPGVSAIDLIVNNVQAGSGNERGRAFYSPQSGFVETGGETFGNQYIKILAQNADNSSTGSQILKDYPATGNVTYVFRWTLDPSYGDKETNTIDYSYSFGDFVQPFIRASATFSVSANGYHEPIVQGLTALSPVIADGADKQAVEVSLNVSDVNNPRIDDLELIINNVRAGSGNERGRFQYTPVNGFLEIGGNSFGNNCVQLVPQDAQNSESGSQILQDVPNGVIKYVFRWTMDPACGERAGNTIDYYFKSGDFVSSFRRSTTVFDVVLSAPQAANNESNSGTGGGAGSPFSMNMMNDVALPIAEEESAPSGEGSAPQGGASVPNPDGAISGDTNLPVENLSDGGVTSPSEI